LRADAPLVSATLIVKDEERHVGACLESLRGLADEIVVVDTGSRDRSREIAASHGARVVDVRWNQDFSAARNLALDHARGQWALYIDADERASGGRHVRQTLADAAAVAGLVRFRAQSGFTRYWEYRLFRIDPRIRFRGVIHETMVPDIDALVRAGGVAVETDLSIDHLGYDGDRSAKHRRDIPMLERAVQADPERVYLWYALGVAHLGLGDAGRAREAWERGAGAIHRREGPAGAGLILLAALADDRHNAKSSAAEWIELATREYGDHPLTWWMRAREAHIAGSDGEAVPLLERLAAVDPDEYIDPRVCMDRRIFRESAYELLGTCWLRLDDPARAAAWLRLAEADSEGRNAAVRVKRELAEARARSKATSST
jgi:glycosyltransferase involved in cell wall biosynthesis